MLLAMAALALAVSPVAAAQARVDPVKQIRELKKAFNKTTEELRQRIVTLEAKQAPPPVIPASLPPTGLAGGDLIGGYPNPLIGPAAVGEGELADGSVGTSELIADSVVSSRLGLGSVNSRALENGAVRAADLGSVIAVEGTAVQVDPGGFGEGIAECPPNTRLISGGYRWLLTGSGPTLADMVTQQSGPVIPAPGAGSPKKWIVKVRLGPEPPGAPNVVFAQALCLAE